MRVFIFLIVSFLLVGCADFGYYWHSVKGHMSIMNKRVDINALLEDPEIDDGLKQRLILVQKIRRFSIDQLALPDSGSYTHYAQLDRAYALQNLFAAPEFSTRLLSWCYPIAGCTSYRGFYEQPRLDDFVVQLKKSNHDIHIGRVPAYSTLGWFDDPVLSSFIHWPDHRLAGLLFHELTHQKIYIDDDSRFNESLASAVQRVGTRLWLKSQNQIKTLEKFNRSILYRVDVVDLIEATRSQLKILYQSDQNDMNKRQRKQEIFVHARSQYQQLVAKHNYRDGYANWFAGELNNAKLASVSTYNALIPAFINMIEAHQYQFDEFFDYAESIGKMDKTQRDACLNAWTHGQALSDSRCL